MPCLANTDIISKLNGNGIFNTEQENVNLGLIRLGQLELPVAGGHTYMPFNILGLLFLFIRNVFNG